MLTLLTLHVLPDVCVPCHCTCNSLYLESPSHLLSDLCIFIFQTLPAPKSCSDSTSEMKPSQILYFHLNSIPPAIFSKNTDLPQHTGESRNINVIARETFVFKTHSPESSSLFLHIVFSNRLISFCICPFLVHL